MTINFDVSTRNAMLDSIEASVGPDPILKIRSGPKPANSAAADSGTVLATVPLPADWMLPASGGQKQKNGTWQDGSADDTGIAGHFRLYMADGVTCKIQGSYGTAGTDMVGDSVQFNTGQPFTINTFTLIAGNQ